MSKTQLDMSIPQSQTYVVMPDRALHWPTRNGVPQLWAKSGHYVDLSHPVLRDLVEGSKQAHKLQPVERIPVGGVVAQQIPTAVRERMAQFDRAHARVAAVPTAKLEPLAPILPPPPAPPAVTAPPATAPEKAPAAPSAPAAGPAATPDPDAIPPAPAALPGKPGASEPKGTK